MLLRLLVLSEGLCGFFVFFFLIILIYRLMHGVGRERSGISV